MARLALHGAALGGTFGGIAQLTTMDIAAAIGLAGLTQGESDLLRVRYCGDDLDTSESGKSVRYWWHAEVHSLGIKLGWPRPSSDRPAWWTLAHYSIREHCAPERCKRCDGVAEVVLASVRKVCPVCGGTGMRFTSQRRLARVARMPQSTWRERGYDACLSICKGELQSRDDRAVAKVAKRLREPS